MWQVNWIAQFCFWARDIYAPCLLDQARYFPARSRLSFCFLGNINHEATCRAVSPLYKKTFLIDPKTPSTLTVAQSKKESAGRTCPGQFGYLVWPLRQKHNFNLVLTDEHKMARALQIYRAMLKNPQDDIQRNNNHGPKPQPRRQVKASATLTGGLKKLYTEFLFLRIEMCTIVERFENII